RGIVFPGKSFFSAHEVSTCKISGCLSYRILDSGPDGTQTTLTRIERHNLNLRQHLARLGRKSLSFSKSVELHDKVIGHYLNIKHYQ
ncbi:IS1 family transposase, partial [Escherichia coli]